MQMLTSVGRRSSNCADIKLFSEMLVFAARANVAESVSAFPVKLCTFDDRLINVVAIAKGIENRVASGTATGRIGSHVLF